MAKSSLFGGNSQGSEDPRFSRAHALQMSGLPLETGQAGARPDFSQPGIMQQLPKMAAQANAGNPLAIEHDPNQGQPTLDKESMRPEQEKTPFDLLRLMFGKAFR